MISLEGKWEMGRAQPSKIRIGKRAKLRVINDCFGMNIEIILCSSHLVDQGSYSRLKIVESKPRACVYKWRDHSGKVPFVVAGRLTRDLEMNKILK